MVGRQAVYTVACQLAMFLFEFPLEPRIVFFLKKSLYAAPDGLVYNLGQKDLRKIKNYAQYCIIVIYFAFLPPPSPPPPPSMLNIMDEESLNIHLGGGGREGKYLKLSWYF